MPMFGLRAWDCLIRLSLLFDISTLLDDTSTPGGVVSALTGYRARPSGSAVLVFLGYWALAFWQLRHAAKGVGK